MLSINPRDTWDYVYVLLEKNKISYMQGKYYFSDAEWLNFR